MTTATHPRIRPSTAARAWSIALYLALAGAAILALAQAPGIWSSRLSPGAPSGITPQ